MGSIGRYSITKRRKDVEREVACALGVRLLAPFPPGALEVAPANPVLNHPDHEGPDSLVVA